MFPSRTDTFGLVLLEAMACGTPVAAYPVTGPIDVVTRGVAGVLDERPAAPPRSPRSSLDRERVRAHARAHLVGAGTAQFVAHSRIPPEA